MLRPYMNWSIFQLEAEFDRSHSSADHAGLEALLHELQCRDRARAKMLRERVVQALGVLCKPSIPSHAPVDGPAERPERGLKGRSETVLRPEEQVDALIPVRPPKREHPKHAAYRRGLGLHGCPRQSARSEAGR